MKTFTIITLGCKVNHYESDDLAGQLERYGWRPAETGSAADLIVVNTCTVTGKASMQSRQALRQAVKSSPSARIVATGCYAQTEPAALQGIAGIHYIVGHADKHRIPAMIMSADGFSSAAPSTICRDVSRKMVFHPPERPVFGGRTRQFLKIQDGCDTFCTYCIVPYARGRSRSMAPDDVLAHLRQLATAGCKEVVLTGIHLGCYGTDRHPKTSLLELMQRIIDTRPMPRVRLSSIEPHELTEDIIDRVAGSDVFCPHFHIPLQSGDDGILHRMHRPYTRAFFTGLLASIHRRLPHAAIGVDILAGFPGETEAAFDQTRTVIETLPVSYLHVFPYSSRPGTPASRYPDKVPDPVIKERCRIMRRIGEENRRQFYEKAVGKTLDVLVEDTRDAATGLLKGFSANYVPVHLGGGDDLKNTIVAVRIDACRTDGSVSGTLSTGGLKPSG